MGLKPEFQVSQDPHLGPLQRSTNQKDYLEGVLYFLQSILPWKMKMKVLLSREIPTQRWLKFLHVIQVLTPEDGYTTVAPSSGRSRGGSILSTKQRSMLCSQCSEVQQISRMSKKSCKKEVLNLTPLIFTAPICNDCGPFSL